MLEDRIIRLNRVRREFNISLERAVDYLKSLDIIIEANPNAKISYAEYSLLKDHFALDKEDKNASEDTSKEESIQQKYTKLSGATLTGQTIDLSQFNKPKSKNTQKSKSTIFDLKELKDKHPKETSNKSQFHQQSSKNKKLGKIKFFDTTKGFGYVHSFDDNKDSFIHISKLITPDIKENDIVIFETVDSKKKPGEYDAIKVSNFIPVFILNNEFESISYAYPLLDNHLKIQIGLTEKLSNGFETISASSRSYNWKVSLIPSIPIPKFESIYYGKKIIATLLNNINMHRSAIEWLF